MTTFAIEIEAPEATTVLVDDDTLSVKLADGRTVAVPLAWFPRLLHGTPAERTTWRLSGRGEGIHWPALDEDIGVKGLLAGRASQESQSSLDRWLKKRSAAASDT